MVDVGCSVWNLLRKFYFVTGVVWILYIRTNNSTDSDQRETRRAMNLVEVRVKPLLLLHVFNVFFFFQLM